MRPLVLFLLCGALVQAGEEPADCLAKLDAADLKVRADALKKALRGIRGQTKPNGETEPGPLAAHKEKIKEAFIKNLDVEDVAIRCVALQGLALYKEEAAPALDLAIKLAKDPSELVRAMALALLLASKSQKEEVGEALFQGLDDANAMARQYASQNIVQVYKRTKLVVRKLVTLLKDKDDQVRLNALAGLSYLRGNLPEEEAIAEFTALLKDKVALIRANAIAVLAEYEKLPPAAIAAVGHCRVDTDDLVRTAARDAMARFEEAKEEKEAKKE